MKPADLLRQAQAVASGILAAVSSERNGGIRSPSGAPQPVTLAVNVNKPAISTTLQHPNVAVAISPWLVGGVVLAAGVLVLLWRNR